MIWVTCGCLVVSGRNITREENPIVNAYVKSTIENVKKKYAHEPEFVQTVEEVLSSVSPLIDKHPEFLSSAAHNINPNDWYPCNHPYKVMITRVS